MLDFLKRDKVQDPFGGDDLYDGESRFAGKGPKIALAASVVLFLVLAGGITAIIMTGKTTPPPVMGSFSDIEVVDEPAPAASPAASPAPAAAPAKTAQAPAAPDATAATDRDIQRRPWLAAPSAPDAKRPGVEAAKPTAPPAPPPPKTVAEAAKPALMTPPAAAPVPPAAAPAQVASAPPAKVPEPTKAEAKPAEMAKEAAKAAPTPEAAKAPVREPAPPETAKEAVVADANPFGPAPGAPGIFNVAPSADSAPSAAGGRPRLVDPAQPPIDKTSIAAPPPRFANITTPKKIDAAAKPPATAPFKIAVVIDGLGLSQSATDAAITKLPAGVTLAFSPYARNLKKWTEKAKAGGHEVLIEVPMESKAFPTEDPGPLGLLTTVEAKENTVRLDAILKNAGDAIGILDTDGSKFRESEPHIGAVFAKLKEKNLFYVQGEPGVRVGDAGVPTAITDVVLDERPFRAAVDARLDYAERLAKYQGSAVATLGAKPVSFERLVLWLEQAQKKGVVIAPISEVLIRGTSSEAPTEKTKAASAGAAESKATGAPAQTKGAPKAAPAKAPAKKS